ncbi:LOW QUALITY PROTEIN: hypothetical protein OSB04_029974 [Centaurea solstitialis]|uniref:Uncharacterized protein n=1 Tax=Centaurea solstitialis TaxID=347529 RepID=A0AA38SJQ9_9ASTR|nr:LOW QUALITY PROTEIN: hypothetical protein OSB04_029974 [Centaurea solstitialis]
MSRASYHLCKLIETVAVDYSFDCSGGMPENNICPTRDGFSICSLGKLSILNADKEKAQKGIGVALALFIAKDQESNPLVSISLPHLKVISELTVDWVLHELNLLEVDFLMKNSVSDMIEKDLHLDCISLLAPLLFCIKDDRVAVSAVLNNDGEGVSSAELSALNVLIKACERSKQMDAIVYLRCHRRKLRLLMSATGVEECFGSQKLSTFSKPKVLAAFETELTENSSTVLHPLLSEEVKTISQCTLEMRNSFSPCGSISFLPIRLLIEKSVRTTRVPLYFLQHLTQATDQQESAIHPSYYAASIISFVITNVRLVCSGSGFAAAAAAPVSLRLFTISSWSFRLKIIDSIPNKMFMWVFTWVFKMNGSGVPMRIIGDIQSMLLAVMCHIASICFSKKSLGADDVDDKESRLGHYIVVNPSSSPGGRILEVRGLRPRAACFSSRASAQNRRELVWAQCGLGYLFQKKKQETKNATAKSFFRLQHLNPNVPVKTHIDLIIAIHEMLAEYGLCCASGDGEEDGTFLKLAIKHLLYLDIKLKLTSINKGLESTQCDEQVSQDGYNKRSGNDSNESEFGKPNLKVGPSDMACSIKEKKHLTEEEKEDLEIKIDAATSLDQCFFCLYGLHLRSDSSYEDDLAMHKNTCRGNYQTKELCADVFQYILPYAKASFFVICKTFYSYMGFHNLMVYWIHIFRELDWLSCEEYFQQPPDSALDGNAIEKFLDDPDLCEDKLSEEAGSDGFQDAIMNIIYLDGSISMRQPATNKSGEPYMDAYRNLFYLLAQSEEMSEEFVQQTAKLFKYDLLFNSLQFESWQRLATEAVLLLNDGSKQINVTSWRKNATFAQRVDTSRRRSM